MTMLSTLSGKLTALGLVKAANDYKTTKTAQNILHTNAKELAFTAKVKNITGRP